MGLKLTKLDRFLKRLLPLSILTNTKPDPEPIYKALDALGSQSRRSDDDRRQ